MGQSMAQNLAKSLSLADGKDSLSVYDVVSASLETFQREVPQGKIASSSEEAIRNAEITITMLPNTSHVQDTFKPFLASDSSHSLKGKLFIDSSTISPAATSALAVELEKRGASLVDAPVSGGVVGATAGTLTFMISSPPSLPSYEKLEAILKTMGKRIIVCGDYAGAGLAAKLANNYALAMTNLATCDAMLLGQKLGLDPKILAEVINTSTGRCWPSEVNNPVPGVLEKSPASKGYEGGFGIGLMRKDLELALQAEREAGEVGSNDNKDIMKGGLSRLSRAALALYKEVEGTEGFGNKDFGVVYKYLKEGRETSEDSDDDVAGTVL